MNEYVRIERDADVVTLVLDAPGKSVNTLNRAMWADLSAALDEIEREKPNGVIILSGKPRTFVAGADLFEMREMDRAALEQYLLDGQRILNRLARLACPTIAAINGDALGGGLELALACKHRIAVADVGTIGLPETKLGLVPGWGGTQRLPRLIGLQQALPILIHGKSLSPREAEQIGLIDDEVPAESELLSAAKFRMRKAPHRKIDPKPDDAALFAETQRDVMARTRGQIPSQLRVIDVARIGWEQGIDAGLAAEKEALADLRDTPETHSLMRAFFLRTGAKKAASIRAGGEAKKVQRIAIIGGGVMGAGVAHAMLKSGIPVTLIEISSDAADRAKQRLAALFNTDVEAGRMQSKAADDAMKKLIARGEWQGIDSADFILEAVMEYLDVKREVMQRIDEFARPDAIVASNTSSLSISELAGATKNPSRVIGLHFFNPVPRMALVEIVSHSQADPNALATAVAMAAKIGKTPVIVGDGPGFIVNRVLMPYLSEAMRMVGEGYPVDMIDKAMSDWGMPMGPLALIDQIGLDVLVGIFHAMAPSLGDRIVLPHSVDMALEHGWLGRKTGRGFYNYPTKRDRGAKPTVHTELAELLAGGNLRAGARQPGPVESRLLMPMMNEAARVISEGVADSTDAVDLATLLGMAFPAFRGGLAAYADSIGPAELVRELEGLAERYGSRFEPANLLRELASSNRKLVDAKR